MANLNILGLVNAVKCNLSDKDKYRYCLSCPYRINVDHCSWSCDIDRLFRDLELLSKYYLERLDLDKEIREGSSLDPEKYVKVGDIQECMSHIPMNSDEMIQVNGLIEWAVGKRSISKDELKVELNKYIPPYTPVCPKGYTDCVCDPAYIRYHHPDWYKDMYGDVGPRECSSDCNNPDEVMGIDCYNDEDK